MLCRHSGFSCAVIAGHYVSNRVGEGHRDPAGFDDVERPVHLAGASEPLTRSQPQQLRVLEQPPPVFFEGITEEHQRIVRAQIPLRRIREE